MLDNSSTRQFILLSILTAVLCVAYFYMLDRAVFSSAYFVPIFQLLLTGYDPQSAWLCAAVCVFAAAWKRPSPILKIIDGFARNPNRVAVIAVMAISLGALTIYHSYPFSMDEYAAVFQARIFATGHLYARLPAALVDWLIVPGFNGVFLVASRETGHAIEGYWPGFALLLAPFEFLGVPWLCNAILAGLAVSLVYRITYEIAGDRRAAGWAMVFTLGSGAFLANAMSFYSMQAHLTANLFFAWLLIKITPRRALAAGLVGSLALVLHNPLPHTLFAAPWIAAIAASKHQRAYLAPLILGYLPGVMVGVSWLWLRINMVPVAHTIAGVSGIGADVFALPDAVLLDMRAASTVKMLIWAIPSLFLISVVGYVRFRESRPIRLLALSAASTFVAYFFVRLDQGHGWGFRYFHSAWGVIPILAGCAMSGSHEIDKRFVSFVGAVTVSSFLIIVPVQMMQIDRVISRHLSQVQPRRGVGNNVYFINPTGGFYMADMIQIDPWLRSRDLILVSRGSKLNLRLVQENWPDAVQIGEGPWGEQWYLGDTDHRRGADGHAADKHFELAYTQPAQPR